MIPDGIPIAQLYQSGGALTREQRQNSGSYAIQHGAISLSENFYLSFVPGTLRSD